MLPRAIDIQRVLPELIWCGFGVLLMLVQPFVRNRHFLSFLALLGSLAGTAASVFALIHGGAGFSGLVESGSVSFFFPLLLGTGAFLGLLGAGPYLDRGPAPVSGVSA